MYYAAVQITAYEYLLPERRQCILQFKSKQRMDQERSQLKLTGLPNNDTK